MNKLSLDRANEIRSNQYYFTYWHGDKGELDRPIFKVQGALGARVPYSYYGTWGSYGYYWDKNATQKFMKMEDSRDNYLEQGSDYPYWYKKYTR